MTVDLERILLGGPEEFSARRDTPQTALPKIGRNFDEIQAALLEIAHPGLVPGTYYPPATIVGSTGAAAVAANNIFYFPFTMPGAEFDQLVIEVTTGAPGLARLGLYTNNRGRPGSLIVDAGEIDTTSIAIVPATIAQRRLPPVFWGAAVFNATPTLRQGAAVNGHLLGHSSPGAVARGLTQAFTYGPLPATAATSLGYGGSSTPAMWVRKAP